MAKHERILLPAAVLLGALFGCEGLIGGDSSEDLLGTEEQPLGSGAGASCAGSKVLICHIPPGNPANTHTICVGQPAVQAHVTHHGDSVSACGGGDNAPGDGGSGVGSVKEGDGNAPQPPPDPGTIG